MQIQQNEVMKIFYNMDQKTLTNQLYETTKEMHMWPLKTANDTNLIYKIENLWHKIHIT